MTSGWWPSSTATPCRSRMPADTSPGSSPPVPDGRWLAGTERRRSSSGTCAVRSSRRMPRATCSRSPRASTSPDGIRSGGPKACGTTSSTPHSRGSSLRDEFVSCFEDQATRKPESAAAASMANGIAGRMATNVLDAGNAPRRGLAVRARGEVRRDAVTGAAVAPPRRREVPRRLTTPARPGQDRACGALAALPARVPVPSRSPACAPARPPGPSRRVELRTSHVLRFESPSKVVYW